MKNTYFIYVYLYIYFIRYHKNWHKYDEHSMFF